MEVPFSVKEFAVEMPSFTEAAIRCKISEGVWLIGREYTKAPDGHVWIIKSRVLEWIYSTMPTLHPGMKHKNLDN